MSLNAERHGIFSSRLFLNDEKPEELALLVSELQETLTPVGTTELVLVERIAVTIWRQRRLIAAETAALELSREPRQVAEAVSSELRRGFGHEVAENDLQIVDKEQCTWCTNVINEIEKLDVIDPR